MTNSTYLRGSHNQLGLFGTESLKSTWKNMIVARDFRVFFLIPCGRCISCAISRRKTQEKVSVTVTSHVAHSPSRQSVSGRPGGHVLPVLHRVACMDHWWKEIRPSIVSSISDRSWNYGASIDGLRLHESACERTRMRHMALQYGAGIAQHPTEGQQPPSELHYSSWDHMTIIWIARSQSHGVVWRAQRSLFTPGVGNTIIIIIITIFIIFIFIIFYLLLLLFFHTLVTLNPEG